KGEQPSLGVQYAVTPRQTISGQAQAAGYGSSLPDDHPSTIWSKHHDKRTQQSQGRQEETGYDAERKEGREEVEEGIQGFPGR
ncbi:MAG: hypothetical protein PVI28_15195, partial [Gammaproteobacteria bacterium]